MAYNGTEYAQLEGNEHPFIVEHLVPIGGAVNIMGLPKQGKSFFILQLAEAIANPRKTHFLGKYQVMEHGPVLIVQLDTPRRLWSHRFRLLSPHLDLRHVWVADKDEAPRSFDIMRPMHFKWVRDEIASMPEPPKLVIFDVLREAHKGKENSADDMTFVMDALANVSSPSAFLVVSHTRKPNYAVAPDDEDADMSTNRGSIFVNGRVDVLMKLTRRHLHVECRTDERQAIPIHQTHQGLWELSAESDHTAPSDVAEPVVATAQSQFPYQQRRTRHSVDLGSGARRNRPTHQG